MSGGLGPVGATCEWNFLSGKAAGQTPASATTYHMALAVGGLTGDPVTGAATVAEAFVPNVLVPCVLIAVYFNVIVAGTHGTTELATVSVRVNNTTDYLVSAAVQFNNTLDNYAVTGLAIPLNAGDFFQVKILTPTWVTLPTAVYMGARVVGRFN